jgi:hypothetical protein
MPFNPSLPSGNEGPNVCIANDQDYTKPDAVEHLVWHMFVSDLTTPQIYHLLTLMAEQEGIGSQQIFEAWRTYDELRRTADSSHSYGLR